jgi:hypothetical protein
MASASSCALGDMGFEEDDAVGFDVSQAEIHIVKARLANTNRQTLRPPLPRRRKSLVKYRCFTGFGAMAKIVFMTALSKSKRHLKFNFASKGLPHAERFGFFASSVSARNQIVGNDKVFSFLVKINR